MQRCEINMFSNLQVSTFQQFDETSGCSYLLLSWDITSCWYCPKHRICSQSDKFAKLHVYNFTHLEKFDAPIGYYMIILSVIIVNCSCQMLQTHLQIDNMYTFTRLKSWTSPLVTVLWYFLGFVCLFFSIVIVTRYLQIGRFTNLYFYHWWLLLSVLLQNKLCLYLQFLKQRIKKKKLKKSTSPLVTIWLW